MRTMHILAAILLMSAPLLVRAETTARAYSTKEVEALTKTGGKAPAYQPPAYSTNGWRLVWSEEFEKPGLPDPAVWRYEVGFVRNHEPQYYTSNRLENVCVRDGHLVIAARKERWPNPLYKDRRLGGWQRERESAGYTSGSITTCGKRSFLYGRIEVRARLPKGRGVWPAIWTLGENIAAKGADRIGWPACGEIDIMEYWGVTADRIAACLHCSKDGAPRGAIHKVAGGGDVRGVKPYDGFHVYTLDWDKDRMNMYYDGRRYGGADLSKADWPDGGNPFRKPQYLLLNLALETDGKKIDSAIFPAEMQVDWVRYYQR